MPKKKVLKRLHQVHPFHVSDVSELKGFVATQDPEDADEMPKVSTGGRGLYHISVQLGFN
jgi:hypothetical protein